MHRSGLLGHADARRVPNARDECRRNAKEAEDPDERDTLLRIAALWDELAERKTHKRSANQ